jgi:phosphate transport system substrate-binding protein
MSPQADGVITSINSWVNTNEAATLLLVAAIGAVCGLAWQRLTRQRRRFGWTVLYDEPINQGDPLTPAAANGSSPAAQQNMWEIIYKDDSDPDAEGHPVTNGSLLVMEMRNIGSVPIREGDFDEGGDFEIRFPGRTVVHYKVRDNDRYRRKVHQENRVVVRPGETDTFTMPSLQMNHNEGFKLLVLLESPTVERPSQYAKPVIDGSIAGGSFVEYPGPGARRRRILLAAGAALLLAAGAFAGFRLANQALSPSPVCASGKLDIEGSTAFAPIANEVVTEYEQHCPQAQITVRAVGSVQGLQDLEHSTSSTPIVAMYDGRPQLPVPFASQSVGVIIFSVVGNRSLPSYWFSAGGRGIDVATIARAYDDPSSFNPRFAPVGRSPDSGTRETFDKMLNGEDSAESNAKQCPAPGSLPPGGVCLEGTTMELLTYVNDTPNAIGYAESDALPFFPDVSTIPINGFEPARQNVLDGNYPFFTTEHLYTNGSPSGLERDLISFLKSQYETAQLRDTEFIACADLGGSRIATACDH